MNIFLDFLFKHRILSFFSCVGLIAVVVYFARFYDNNNQDSYSSLIGTIITILGFVLTVSQLKTVEEIATDTQAKVDNAVGLVKTRIKEILSISECVAAQQTVNEIEKYISEKKFEIAVLKFRETHKVLIGIFSDKELKTKTSVNLDLLVKNVGLDKTNLYANISTPDKVDVTEIYLHLKDASVVFIEIENYLKNRAL